MTMTTVNTTRRATVDQTRDSDETASAPRPQDLDDRPDVRGIATMLLWDVGLSLGAYYGARALGFSPYVALLAGTVAAGLRVGYVALRSRKLDGFAAFLLGVFGVGLGLSFVTGDARFLLVKDSFTTAVAGLIFLGTCVFGRPLVFYAAKRATSGNAEREAAWEERWASEPGVRRTFLMLSLGWGFGLLAEAVVRIPLVYLLSIDVMAGLSTVIQVAAFALLTVWTIAYIKRARAHAAERGDR